jgi:lysine decarboxylase
LLAAYLDRLAAADAPFTTPGHKRQAAALDGGLGLAVDRDVPAYGGLDDVKATGGTLLAAEARAAALWGGDWARLSTGGSTHGNQSLLLALGRPGQRVVVSRAVHRSTFSGLVLAGLDPVWVPVRIDPTTAVPVGTPAAAVADALDVHPDAAGVLVVEPGYLGTVGDVAALAAATVARDVPLLVDQAWGAHFGFHPAYPVHALEAGADALVTSLHKTLPGYSAAAIVVARTRRLERERLEQAFETIHTTSPPGATLASADAARALLHTRAVELLERLRGLVAGARARLRTEVPGIGILDESTLGAGRFDPAKLVVQTAPVGADGVAVERDLLRRGLPVELADRDTVVAQVTVADDERSVDRLITALAASLLARAGEVRRRMVAVSWSVTPEPAVSPRDAFFAPAETVPALAAAGRVSAELIAPYPPGVPVLAPGEVIARETVEGLREAAAQGVRVAYASDPTLATVRVLTRRP